MGPGLGRAALLVLVSATACRTRSAPPSPDASAVAATGASLSPAAAARDTATSPASDAATRPTVDAATTLACARVPGLAYAAVTADAAPIVGAAGKADVARDVEATADTVFEAASIGKLVVATCVMQLVERGVTSLDADVSTAVGFPVTHRGRAVTLRMLLTHTAAVRDHDLVETADVPADEYLRRTFVERRAEAFYPREPGAAYAYSNVGYALAALAVERLAGAPFRDVAQAHVLAPLGMTSTSWSARSVDAARLAVPYAWTGSGYAPRRQASHVVWAAADLRSTARDLARFARMLLRGGELDGARVLGAGSVAAMLANGVQEDRGGRGGDDAQGLGFQLRTLGGARVAGHEGEDEGASAALFVDPTRRVGALFLANGDAFSSDDPARAAAFAALLEGLLRSAAPR